MTINYLYHYLPLKKHQIHSILYAILLVSILFSSVIIQQNNFILSNTLDSSWMFTLNYAVSNNLVFGKDIIFTFGPLGFICYPITEGLTNTLLLLSYIFKYIYVLYTTLVLYEMYVSIRFIESKELAKLVKYILLPWLTIKIGFNVDYTIFIFIGLIHSSIVNLTESNKFTLSIYEINKFELFFIIFNAITCALLIFLKVSFLPFSLVVVSLMVLRFLYRKQYMYISLYLFFLLITLLTVYACFNIDFKEYIINSLDIISGYKKAMQIYQGSDYEKAYLVAVACAALFIYQLYRIRLELFSIENLSKLLLITLAFYYCFSYSFTRGSASLFFKCSVVSVIIFTTFYLTNSSEAKNRFYTLIILILSFGFFNYFYEDLLFLTNWNHDQYRYKERIPKSLLDNSKTYDVLPYATSIAYFNKLTYHPRPIFQSYSDYTLKLDSINARFFSKKSVDNIIFHTNLTNSVWGNTIDERYFMYEEPLTKIEILKKYTMFSKADNHLFLVTRRKQDVNMQLKLINQKIYSLDQTINLNQIDTTKLYFFTADFNYSKIANITSIFYKFPYVKVELTTTDNTTLQFNTVSDLLKNPCVLNKYCANYYDFFNLFQREKFRSLKNIKSIRFTSNQEGYVNAFEFKLFEASIPN